MKHKHKKKREQRTVFQTDTTVVPSASEPKVRFIVTKPKLEKLQELENVAYGKTLKQVLENLRLEGADASYSPAVVAAFLQAASNMLDSLNSFSRSDFTYFGKHFDLDNAQCNVMFQAFCDALVKEGKLKQIDSCYEQAVYVQQPYQFIQRVVAL